MSISRENCSSTLVLFRFLREVVVFLFLMVKWLLFPRYDWWPTSSSAEEEAEGGKGAEDRAPHRAAAQAVRETLHVSTYGEVAGEEEEEEEAGAVATACAVCLSEVGRWDKVWELRNCRHVFHQGCLDRWLDHDEHLSCPLCREPLLARWPPSLPPPPPEPSWAVEHLLYLFGDDLLPAPSS
ncbi:Zinc finger, C3HC4 type (RING finger) [Musa troglodytarum]|uniref:Zinc finger, C3HC4 type (RING finger) n=1 Tax=Musa troglodytarum TaxID=320322 RepID=A0A9E7GNY6_9LILI|nr:Zinc finger, C3HC4 type (RING finger) [Musa troglodytarum]